MSIPQGTDSQLNEVIMNNPNTTPKELLLECMKVLQWKISDLKSDEHRVILHGHLQNMAHKLKFSVRAVEAQIEPLVYQTLADSRRAVAAYIPHPDLKPVSSLYANADPQLDNAISYFIWQVKRKALGLPVNQRVALIMYSPIGGLGKTSLIRHILGVFDQHSKEVIVPSELIGTPSFEALADERNFLANARNSVLFCDELQKAAGADLSTIKNLIYEDKAEARVLGHNSRRTATNYSVLCGTSNKPMDEILYDRSGYRRWWVVNHPGLPTGALEGNWSAYENYPWKQLWESVDPSVIHHCEQFLLEKKHESKSADPIDNWLEYDRPSEEESFYKSKPGGWRTSEFLASYHRWARDNKLKDPYTQKTFPDALETRGWTRRKSSGNYYYVPPVESVPLPAEPTHTIIVSELSTVQSGDLNA